MNLSASASLQARTIFALMLRRIRTRYANSRAGYLWAIVEPICWVFILKFGIRGAADHQPPIGTSYEVFYANGVIVARTWRTTAQVVARTVRRPKRSALTAIHRLDAAYAAWILELTTGAVAMTIVLAALGLFGFDAAPADPLTCFVAFGAMALFALAFGLVLSLILTLAPGLTHFQHIFMLAIFMSSGFHMIIDRVPPRIREIFLWNPVLHCVEWFREGFYAGYVCASLDRSYLLTVTMLFLAIGLVGERALRNHNPQRKR
ncbi:transport permease protein [Hansschlegelia plantiphila]|uniref:Transport permease protein n=2 Tax=Hansschlegelia plantiphila TaxID=374655 RepID=A0A9W6IZA8_9HYPH|nr:transport permease protein [Hansschlegelia plantiphila]